MKRIFVLLLINFSLVFCQSLRPSHWLADYVEFEQARGYLWSLSPLTRPHESAELLAQLRSELAGSGDASQPAYERSLYMLARLDKNPSRNGELQAGVELDEFAEGNGSRMLFHSRNRLGVAYRLRPWLQAVSSTVMDNRLDEDPLYQGIRQSGVSAYTETAYLRFSHRGFTLSAGRDHLLLGAGIDAALFISSQSRPLDHLRLAYQSPRWRYSFIAAQLDPMTIADGEGTKEMARYLAMHRLEIRATPWLHLAIGEAVLYGTPSAPHWAFLNPFLFFHGEQMNGPQAGNILGCLQAVWMPKRNLMIHGDFLIDDIQIEKNEAGDYEPDEYGFTIGARWADPLRWRGAEFYGEYTRVTNRTYNSQGGEWEKWLHRRTPLGHFLGNDFDRILTGLQIWPKSAFRLRLQYEHRRRGEGRIENRFDTPWMETPDFEHYSEPFPTGLVETSDRAQCLLNWHPVWWLRTIGLFERVFLRNENHVRGKEDSFWQVRLGLGLEGLIKFQINE